MSSILAGRTSSQERQIPRFGYARVSTEDQNLDLQISELKTAGVDEIFEEKESGAKDDRPKLNELLATLRPSDELYVWKLDRLGRSNIHLHTIVKDLKERGIIFVSLRDGLRIDASGSGKMHFGILALLAEDERDRISERTKAGMAVAKAKGVILGHRHYGFERGSNSQVDDEAEVIKGIAKRVLSGEALRAVARDLNSDGIPTTRGNGWEATTVRRILGNDRVATIIGHDMHAELLAMLNVRSQRQGKPAAHLLSGFVFCDCGTPMYCNRRKDGTWIYKCKRGQRKYPNTCGRLSIVAEPLEQEVTIAAWKRWEVWQEVTEEDTSEVNAKIADLESKLADLAQRVRTGMAMEFAAPLEAGWRADLDAARRQRDRHVRVSGYQRLPWRVEADLVVEQWNAWTMEARRELLRGLGLRVQVKPGAARGRAFDPERVEVTFSGR